MLHADCLSAYQQALDNRDLVEFAAPVGLDLPQFIREMAERRYAFRVREDFLSGVCSGVNGTPTFFHQRRVSGRIESTVALVRH